MDHTHAAAPTYNATASMVHHHHDEARQMMDMLSSLPASDFRIHPEHLRPCDHALIRAIVSDDLQDFLAELRDIEDAGVEIPASDERNEADGGLRPLCVAAACGRVEMVRALLQQTSVNPNARCAVLARVAFTPLHHAVLAGSEQVVELLLSDSRVDVNSVCVDVRAMENQAAGRLDVGYLCVLTPTCLAHRQWFIANSPVHARIFRRLLDCPRVSFSVGKTPASTLRPASVLELLALRALDDGITKQVIADPRASKERLGEEAIFAAIEISISSGTHSVAHLIAQQHNLDPNASTPGSCPPLYMACQANECEAIFNMLRDPRVDCNFRLPLSNETPLSVCMELGRTDALLYLLACSGSALRHDIAVSRSGVLSPENPERPGEDWLEFVRLFDKEEISPLEIGGLKLLLVEHAILEERRKPQPSSGLLMKLASMKETYEACVKMLQFYINDPAEARATCQSHLGEALAPQVFSLGVLLSDGLLRIRPAAAGQPGARFWSVASVLPMELQMVLCRRMFGLDGDVLHRAACEPEYVHFLRLFEAGL